MKTIALILSLFLLTSCSNPDTSGGVELSRGGGDNGTTDEFTYTDQFPHGSCTKPATLGPVSQRTGCGEVWVHGEDYYIKPHARLMESFLFSSFFDRLNLSGANLAFAKMFWVYMSYADLSNANLMAADLRVADLSDAILSSANLFGANLWSADLDRADLSGASLIYAYLRDADLRDADLSGAWLSGANLSGANLSGAILTGVKASSWTTCPNGKKWRTAGNNCGF